MQKYNDKDHKNRLYIIESIGLVDINAEGRVWYHVDIDLNKFNNKYGHYEKKYMMNFLIKDAHKRIGDMYRFDWTKKSIGHIRQILITLYSLILVG